MKKKNNIPKLGGPAIWEDKDDNRRAYVIGIVSMQFEICGDEPLMEPTVPNIFAAIPGKVSKWIHKMIKDDLECSSGNDIQSSSTENLVKLPKPRSIPPPKPPRKKIPGKSNAPPKPPRKKI